MNIGKKVALYKEKLGFKNYKKKYKVKSQKKMNKNLWYLKSQHMT